jgi:hypothetical protein
VSGSLLSNAAEPAFARHETFHPRFGWLRKAVSCAQEDPGVFSDPEATVRLGVGKNMVNAIRYWGLAFKVLEQRANPDRPRVPLIVPSNFGEFLLGDDGLDPYLEDSGSLWLLHWKLLAPPCVAPAWWIAFNDFTPQQFTEAQLTAHIVELVAAAGWPPVVEASVKKDVDCLIRTYSQRRQGRASLDDIIDCPFRDLGLIETAAGEGGRVWRFGLGDKANLPDAVVAYATLDFAARLGGGARSISIARLAHDPGSPGAAFRLTETDLFETLRRHSADHAQLRVAEPAGLRQCLFDGDPAELAELVLADHYATSNVDGIKTA